MAQQPELPSDLMTLALHQALLKKGFKPGHVFVGKEWTHRVKLACNVQHPNAVRNWTDFGEAMQLWKVEPGLGRGNETRITLLDGRRAHAARSGQQLEPSSVPS